MFFAKIVSSLLVLVKQYCTFFLFVSQTCFRRQMKPSEIKCLRWKYIISCMLKNYITAVLLLSLQDITNWISSINIPPLFSYHFPYKMFYKTLSMKKYFSFDRNISNEIWFHEITSYFIWYRFCLLLKQFVFRTNDYQDDNGNIINIFCVYALE